MMAPVVASVALARRMERAGADAVVAEGCESGGHIGETTTMALVPQVADAVKIPVIAAGGIADGRGMAAAFMLGAEAVQMGTRFVASKEAVVHENYKPRAFLLDPIHREYRRCLLDTLSFPPLAFVSFPIGWLYSPGMAAPLQRSGSYRFFPFPLLFWRAP